MYDIICTDYDIIVKIINHGERIYDVRIAWPLTCS